MNDMGSVTQLDLVISDGWYDGSKNVASPTSIGRFRRSMQQKPEKEQNTNVQ
jgi:hypothetical protein